MVQFLLFQTNHFRAYKLTLISQRITICGSKMTKIQCEIKKP